MNTHLTFRKIALLLALGFQVAVMNGQAPAPVDLTPKKIVVDGKEMFQLGFDKLSSFTYTLVDAGTGATPEEIEAHLKKDPVPAWVHLYDNQRVMLTGYMMPLQIENGRSKKFVMMRDVNTCCYGAVPNMNDYLVVTMAGEGIEVVQDVPVDLVGVFHIDHRYEGGYVVSLFAMTGEKFLGPRK
ncbi:hypothetical protein OPIT5_09090 [Opitutaceae bacterium TAV5]|nr:hypothetical protein OPIT5_09090 [Opitutaceae bacterium TAV5]